MEIGKKQKEIKLGKQKTKLGKWKLLSLMIIRDKRPFKINGKKKRKEYQSPKRVLTTKRALNQCGS